MHAVAERACSSVSVKARLLLLLVSPHEHHSLILRLYLRGGLHYHPNILFVLVFVDLRDFFRLLLQARTGGVDESGADGKGDGAGGGGPARDPKRQSIAQQKQARLCLSLSSTYTFSLIISLCADDSIFLTLSGILVC